ncbi:hypothetical protein NH8B_1784 [Pseudogulbenkiania sp. NH8B]|uniref:hypothetical protein n=1 Tax=Pseudogulbenkiania sp. (strain NH8B) TaxID=748280 RepID=UPI0002279DE4|nr:hypothetical protein [Pseudogulbenkiania sp. NH8B]BAK76601.1 hypothetical protein NH8B_1784 [Pseudogulbenkiania sp. NH8B]
MSIDAEFLLSRLPAFYRERDAEQGGPLRALLDIIAEQGNLLEQDIATLYDNWFIETCDDWLIPYIGDLLGVRGLYAVGGTQSFGQRGLVANTLRLRRRKGTVPVLEQLAFDCTGWRARAVEFFELLGTTQYLNHRRLHNQRTPNIRDAIAMERVDGPFDRSAHSAEVRPLSGGRYNIPNVGLYLWRLQAYALQRATARVAGGEAGRYYFDALGRSVADDAGTADGVLYNRPRTESEITQLAQPIHVPEPLSRRVLHAELTALRQAIADGETPSPRYFAEDEGGPVLRIWLDGSEVPPEHLVVCNLALLAKVNPGDPDDWRRPPVQLAVVPRGGGPARAFPDAPGRYLVGFDPVLGRIALPAGKTVGTVEVAYAYGFPGDVGGGPYDRRPLRREDDESEGLLDPSEFEVVWRVPGDHPSLAAALAALAPGSRTLIRLLGDASESLTPVLNLPDTHLAIEAENRHRPVLLGDWSLQGNASTRLTLSGLLLDGALTLSGPLAVVALRHCSLSPDKGGMRHAGSGSGLLIRLSHCLCGALQVSQAIAGVSARYSVFDNGDALVFDLPDTLLELERCTVLGSTKAGGLTASNSLFSQPLAIVRKQQGCVRFCYVPPGSQTPRRYRCQPDLVIQGLSPALAQQESVRVTPAFTSTRFGHPAYVQLRLSTAPEIRKGAEDGAEMGVWNLLQQPQREANLHQALDEYLRFGLEAGIIYVN